MTKFFQIQIHVKQGDGSRKWKPLRPKGGKPYTFPTWDEAYDTAQRCYPDDLLIYGVGEKSGVRIIHSTDKARFIQEEE